MDYTHINKVKTGRQSVAVLENFYTDLAQN